MKNNILIISADMKQNSNTMAVSRFMEAFSKEHFCTFHTNLFSLYEEFGSKENKFSFSPKIAHAIKNTSLLIIVTPVYHGSFSGALKLFFDHMDMRELEGKKVALISQGAKRTTNALDSLRILCRNLSAHVCIKQLCYDMGSFVTLKNGHSSFQPSLGDIQKLSLLFDELVSSMPMLDEYQLESIG